MKEGIKGLVDVAVAPKFDMDLEMIYESDGKPGRLQVRILVGVGCDTMDYKQNSSFCCVNLIYAGC